MRQVECWGGRQGMGMEAVLEEGIWVRIKVQQLVWGRLPSVEEVSGNKEMEDSKRTELMIDK